MLLPLDWEFPEDRDDFSTVLGSPWAGPLPPPSDWNSLRSGTGLSPSHHEPFILQSVPHSGAGLSTFAITTGWGERGEEEEKERKHLVGEDGELGGRGSLKHGGERALVIS